MFWHIGVVRKVFWRSGNGKKSGDVREWGVWGSPPFEDAIFTPGAGVGGLGGPPHSKMRHSPLVRERGVWGVPPFEETTSTPFSSDKIRAKILDLGYGGAHRALHNLSPKSVRILSAAITIDGWTGALSDGLAPPQGLGGPSRC